MTVRIMNTIQNRTIVLSCVLATIHVHHIDSSTIKKSKKKILGYIRILWNKIPLVQCQSSSSNVLLHVCGVRG